MQGRIAFGFMVLATGYGVVALALASAAWGPAAAYIWVQPLLVAALLWVLLHRACSRGDERAALIAAAIAALYLVWSFLAGFSVAAGGLPAAVLLCLAVALTPVAHAPSDG